MTPDYFVRSSINTDDTATFEDRETGNQDLAVTVKQEHDGSDDARNALSLTIDLDVTPGAFVTVNINGREYAAVEVR